jgi:hypothetical protein
MGEGERAIEMVREWAESTKHLRKSPARRGPGRPADKWREVLIKEAMAELLGQYPKLGAYKNPATPTPNGWDGSPVLENACAIVAEALRRAGIQVTDKAVANTWERSRILRDAKPRKVH